MSARRWPGTCARAPGRDDARAVFLPLARAAPAADRQRVARSSARACQRAGMARAGRAPAPAHRGMRVLRGRGGAAEVGQVLRHRQSAATAVYAKVDRPRCVLARPWPGVAR